MQENLFIRFNEIILLIYLISIICYFYDFVQKSHKIRSLGIYLLGIVWVLQTISLSIFIIQTMMIQTLVIAVLLKIRECAMIMENLIWDRIW